MSYLHVTLGMRVRSSWVLGGEAKKGSPAGYSGNPGVSAVYTITRVFYRRADADPGSSDSPLGTGVNAVRTGKLIE